MEFLQGASGQAFALYAGVAGLATAFGLARSARNPAVAASRRESLLGPLGLAALAVAFMMDAPSGLRLLAGGLLMAGLVILALAPRWNNRPSAGRRVGTLLAGLSVTLALAGAFLPALATPHSLT